MTVFTTVFAMTLLLSVAAEEKSVRIFPKPPSFIVVKVADSRLDKHAIELTVDLVSTSDKDIEITVMSGDQPFRVNIYDKNGVNINRYAQRVRKDRSNRHDKLILPANGEKRQKIKILTVTDEKGGKQQISPGTYNVSIVLPIVTYVDGQYRVELVKSDLIEVVVE